jgi:hypothetical protein
LIYLKEICIDSGYCRPAVPELIVTLGERWGTMKALLSRYRMIFPSEHGSWSLMLMPFIIGAGVAATQSPARHAAAGIALCLVAVLAVFLARQPIGLWVRIARGKGRRADAPAARFWSLGLLAAAGLAGAGLLALGRWAILWLALPALAALILTLGLTVRLGPRQLAVELIGVTALALGAPAGYASGTGRLDSTAWLVWGISALHSVTSVLYVRLRIDTQHDRDTHSQAWWVVAAHVLSLIAVLAALAIGWLPWLVALPTALLLARSLAAARYRPHIDDVRRFGFTEMGLALGFAAMVILAFALR